MISIKYIRFQKVKFPPKLVNEYKKFKLPATMHGHINTEERKGTVLVVLAGLILGTMGIFVIEAGQDPITTVAFRCAFGCLALLS